MPTEVIGPPLFIGMLMLLLVGKASPAMFLS